MEAHAPPFYMTFRIAEVELDCGEITRAIYDRAPGGAFGKVFFGSWRRLRVAVKILATRAGVAADVADAAFKKEVENMLAVRSTIDRAKVRASVRAALSEPCNLPDPARRCTLTHNLAGFENAVLVYGVGTEPDLSAVAPGLPPGPAHLIVMEELTGGTLEEPSSIPLTIAELEKVAAGLASGLSLLHAAHVVHADLKGANIIRRTLDGAVVLTDYGVGRIANAGVDVVVYPGEAAGTMLYLAPELVGGGRANTFASDIYAYGLVLWCLFSGRSHAWEDEDGGFPTQLSLVDRVRGGGRPDLAALRHDTPYAITTLIQRCWAQDPAARPMAAAIAQEMETWHTAPTAAQVSAAQAAQAAATHVAQQVAREAATRAAQQAAAQAAQAAATQAAQHAAQEAAAQAAKQAAVQAAQAAAAQAAQHAAQEAAAQAAKQAAVQAAQAAAAQAAQHAAQEAAAQAAQQAAAQAAQAAAAQAAQHAAQEAAAQAAQQAVTHAMHAAAAKAVLEAANKAAALAAQAAVEHASRDIAGISIAAAARAAEQAAKQAAQQAAAQAAHETGAHAAQFAAAQLAADAAKAAATRAAEHAAAQAAMEAAAQAAMQAAARASEQVAVEAAQLTATQLAAEGAEQLAAAAAQRAAVQAAECALEESAVLAAQQAAASAARAAQAATADAAKTLAGQAVALAFFAVEAGVEVVRAARGVITPREAALRTVDCAAGAGVAYVGGIAGQILVPVPVLGAVIGGTVGSYVGRKAASSVTNLLRDRDPVPRDDALRPQDSFATNDCP